MRKEKKKSAHQTRFKSQVLEKVCAKSCPGEKTAGSAHSAKIREDPGSNDSAADSENQNDIIPLSKVQALIKG